MKESRCTATASLHKHPNVYVSILCNIHVASVAYKYHSQKRELRKVENGRMRAKLNLPFDLCSPRLQRCGFRGSWISWPPWDSSTARPICRPWLPRGETSTPPSKDYWAPSPPNSSSAVWAPGGRGCCGKGWRGDHNKMNTILHHMKKRKAN